MFIPDPATKKVKGRRQTRRIRNGMDESEASKAQKRCSKKLDPLADGTIEMVLSKVVEFKDFTLFRDITTQDVKGHLLEMVLS